MTVVRFAVTCPGADGDVSELSVEGEIDVSNVDEFGQRMSECMVDSCRVLMMNTAGLTFIDSSGLRVIVEAAKHMRDRDGQLVIKDPPPILRRIIDVSGLTDFLGLEDETGQAPA
jgi:anti-anti-sigma factor